ncbi:MAG: acyl-CoA dehydrogenase family protein [Dongiaceae bacterium]
MGLSSDLHDQDRAAQNSFGTDMALQRWLQRRAPDLLARHRERLEAFGAWVAKDVDQAAAYTDRLAPPHLAARPASADPQAIGMAADLATEVIHNPAYQAIHRGAYERGMIGLNYGPQPAPFLLTFTMGYLLAQADISVHCPVTLTGAVAYVLDRFAPAEVQQVYRSALIRMDGTAATGGTWATERQGGSDVGANATMAVAGKDGAVTLHGLKWFCSNAASDLALATARPEGAAAGGDGLGLYLVPRRLADGTANRYRVRRLKEKLGTRGLATGEIDLLDAAAIEVAPPPRGLRMMMEALAYSRVHNAMAATGIQRRAFVEALAYSRERHSFGAALIDHPAVRSRLLDLQMELEASLVLSLTTAEVFDAAQQDAGRQIWLRLLTALAKYRTAELAVSGASAAIEILGGNGYTDDYVAERLLRDAQVLPVWEGPANIQALEILRLILGKADGGRIFADEMTSMLDGIGSGLSQAAEPVRRGLNGFTEILGQLRQDTAAAPRHGLALMELMADLACATLLLRDADAELVAGDGRQARLARRYVTRRFERPPHAGPDIHAASDAKTELEILLYRPVSD